jgi:hypothetical protein
MPGHSVYRLNASVASHVPAPGRNFAAIRAHHPLTLPFLRATIR